jgi:hypothetical protein
LRTQAEFGRDAGRVGQESSPECRVCREPRHEPLRFA